MKRGVDDTTTEDYDYDQLMIFKAESARVDEWLCIGNITYTNGAELQVHLDMTVDDIYEMEQRLLDEFMRGMRPLAIATVEINVRGATGAPSFWEHYPCLQTFATMTSRITKAMLRARNVNKRVSIRKADLSINQ